LIVEIFNKQIILGMWSF